jgi:hypothetical protein
VSLENRKDNIEIFSSSGLIIIPPLIERGLYCNHLFLSVEAEITVTKVFITANMKNSKSHCKQEIDVR